MAYEMPNIDLNKFEIECSEIVEDEGVVESILVA